MMMDGECAGPPPENTPSTHHPPNTDAHPGGATPTTADTGPNKENDSHPTHHGQATFIRTG